MTTSTRPAMRVALIVAQLGYGLLAMMLCIPSMPDWATQFGQSQAEVQLSFSAFVVTFGAMQLVYGPASDRLGRKRVLLAGLAVAALGSVAAALATSLWPLVAARALQGAGAAAGMVISRALVQDFFQGPERTRVLGYVGMAMGLMPPLATLLGGQLHVHLGWPSNFVLSAVLAVVLWVAAWRGLAPDRPERSTAPGAPSAWQATTRAYARLAREPAFARYVLVMAMATATFYAFLGGAPLVLRRFGVGPEGVGLYIMCVPLSYIVGNYLTTRWVRQHGEARIMAWGQGLTLAGAALMPGLALAGADHPLAIVLPLLVLGLGHGLLVPPTLAGSVGLVPALAGAAAAVAGVGQQVLGAAGGWAVGLLDHAHSAAPLGLLMLALASAGALAQLGLHRPGMRPREAATVERR